MDTRVERINPSLDVQDLTASVRYYVELLGFDLMVETPNLAILECDGHQIHLRKGEGESAMVWLWIGVEDVHVLYEQYRSRNVKIKQEPTNYSWACQMMVADLDGNLLVIGSAPLECVPFQDRSTAN